MQSKDFGVKQFYDRVGDYFSYTRKWLWPEMLPYLTRLTTNDTVLDIGCGNGRLVSGLPAKVNYIGVDFSKMLLANARKLHPNYTFEYGDLLDEATWKKLPKAEFIFSVAVLHHMREVQLSFIFDQIASKMKKNGLAYISVWNLWQRNYWKHHFSLKSLMTKLRHLDLSLVWIPFQNKADRFCVAHSPSRLQSEVRKAGLVVEKFFYSGKNTLVDGRNMVLVLRKD